ncbi:MAG TPA: DNA sulfur modification protein DndB [Clostridium sp.]
MGDVKNIREPNWGDEDSDMIQRENKSDEIWETSKSESLIAEDEEVQTQKDAKILKKEIRLNNKEIKNHIKNKEFEWEFSPVIPIYRQGEIRKYNTTISAYDLASIFQSGVAKYIPSIQRGTKILPSGKEQDSFSTKHVNEILHAFLENRIHGNTIVFNYSLDNETNLEYSENEGKISGSENLQILDGSHRARSALKWKKLWERNPDQYEDPRQYQLACCVENISDNDAKQLFAEYNNFALKVNKTRISFLDVENSSNQIVRKIMKESDLKGKIETVSTSIRHSSPNVVTFGVLTNAIKKFYAPQTKREQEDISNYLVEFIDELVNIFPEFLANPDLEKRNELKKQYFTIEPMAFGAWVALSSELRGDTNWKKKLSKLKDSDFLLRDKDHFKQILREGGRVINTSSTQKYFSQILIDFITK